MATKQPAGYRFRPTNNEVISLLQLKANGGKLHPFYPIVERSLFGDNPPWNVLSAHDPWEYVSDAKKPKKIVYVYSKLDGPRAVRKTANGTWVGQSTNNIKNSGGVVVGHKKYYRYKATKNGSETMGKGNWEMYVYSFLNNKSGHVLCEVKADAATGCEDARAVLRIFVASNDI